MFYKDGWQDDTMNWLEVLGFIASLVVAVSLMMRNVFWLRVINGIGALVFCLYGILIQSSPVAVMNGFVFLIDMYFLIQTLRPDYYEVLQVESGAYYLHKFLSFYQKEIRRFIPEFNGDISSGAAVFFILRNMVPAGLLVVREHENGTLWIELDFAIPAYRDFKLGRFVYDHHAEIFNAERYDQVYCEATERSHQRYLMRMGFSQVGESLFILPLQPVIHRLGSQQTGDSKE
jgi:hypothetical protein